MKFLKNYINNLKEGFVPDDDTKGFKGILSRIKNLWKHSIQGKITIIFIALLLTVPTENEDTCWLAGCDLEGQGWYHETKPQPSILGPQTGCLRTMSSGGYCSKNHCAEDR